MVSVKGFNLFDKNALSIQRRALGYRSTRSSHKPVEESLGVFIVKKKELLASGAQQS